MSNIIRNSMIIILNTSIVAGAAWAQAPVSSADVTPAVSRQRQNTYIPRSTDMMSVSQRARFRFVQQAWFNTFNKTSMTPTQVANKYFSKKLKFYTDDTQKVITYDKIIGRIKACRSQFRSTLDIYSHPIFTDFGSSMAENHYTVATNNNGLIQIVDVTNQYVFDKQGKILRIYNIMQTLSPNKQEAVHDAYMTKNIAYKAK